jgi:Actin-like ATPase involved in cell division
MIPKNLVAVDDGYAQVKVWKPADGDKPAIRALVPTALRSGRGAITGLDGRALGSSYTTGNETFVAEIGVSEETRWDGYHVSTMNRVSVHHGLAQAGFRDARLHVVAGLPVREYFKNGVRNTDFINRKIESLKQPVTHADGNSIEITGVIIAPQAVSVFADWAMDERFSLRDPDLRQAEVAVVDVGGRTTDIAVIVRAGTGVDHARSGTENIGMLDVLTEINNGLRSKFDLSDERLPIKVLQDALRTGKARLFGREKDVADVVQQAVSEVEARIARTVRQMLGSGVALHSVLLVGGGIAAMPNLAKVYPSNAVIVPDPEFANSRGMYRLGVGALIKDGQRAA